SIANSAGAAPGGQHLERRSRFPILSLAATGGRPATTASMTRLCAEHDILRVESRESQFLEKKQLSKTKPFAEGRIWTSCGPQARGVPN
ncbi:MAG: hypothetical protein ACPIOQ_47875, partial [Promethearchaeia archaeon]